MQERQLSGGMHEDQWFHSWANLRPYMKNRPRKVKHSLWSREFHIRLETYQAASQKFVKICSRFYYPFHLTNFLAQNIVKLCLQIHPFNLTRFLPQVQNSRNFTYATIQFDEISKFDRFSNLMRLAWIHSCATTIFLCSPKSA